MTSVGTGTLSSLGREFSGCRDAASRTRERHRHHLSGIEKDPTDPQWQDTPEFKDWLTWMKRYNSSGNVADAANVYGYDAAQTMIAVLKACGDNLTRENVMKQAASIRDLKLPMLLPGITISTSTDDYAPIKQMQLRKFDGTTWQLFGEVISGSGS